MTTTSMEFDANLVWICGIATVAAYAVLVAFVLSVDAVERRREEAFLDSLKERGTKGYGAVLDKLDRMAEAKKGDNR